MSWNCQNWFPFQGSPDDLGLRPRTTLDKMSQILHMNLFQVYNWLWFSSSRFASFLRHCERKIYHREVPAPKLENLENQCCYNKAMTRDPKIQVWCWWQTNIRDIVDEFEMTCHQNKCSESLTLYSLFELSMHQFSYFKLSKNSDNLKNININQLRYCLSFFGYSRLIFVNQQKQDWFI